MKIKAYKATKKKNIYLKFSETPVGVDVVAVNEDGSFVTSGTILTIEPDGIRFHTSVNVSVGLPLDAKGAVIALYEGES